MLGWLLAVLHAVVDLDDRRLRRLQARVGFVHHGQLGRPAFIALAAVPGFVQHLRLATKAAEDEVAVVAVLLAVSAHMPAHAGVDQRVGWMTLYSSTDAAAVRATRCVLPVRLGIAKHLAVCGRGRAALRFSRELYSSTVGGRLSGYALLTIYSAALLK